MININTSPSSDYDDTVEFCDKHDINEAVYMISSIGKLAVNDVFQSNQVNEDSIECKSVKNENEDTRQAANMLMNLLTQAKESQTIKRNAEELEIALSFLSKKHRSFENSRNSSTSSSDFSNTYSRSKNITESQSIRVTLNTLADVASQHPTSINIG